MESEKCRSSEYMKNKESHLLENSYNKIMDNNDVCIDSKILKENMENKNKLLDVIKEGLSDIEKTLNGEGYAFSNLNCSYKNIEYIPKEIIEYIYLKYIDMSHNKIENISNLYKLDNILFLDTSYNLINNLDEIKSMYLKNCIYMNISHNSINIIKDIKMKNIIELDLSYNNIENLDIYFPESLKNLNMSNNNIKNICFKNKLENLELLDISSNPIENLNFYEIIPNIKTLKLNDNYSLPINNLSELNNFKNIQFLDMENYLHFKDISYTEIKQILFQNTPDVILKKFNGNIIIKNESRYEKPTK
ncbi:leucine-rich repeat protein [Plasmodium berghei]|uniref:Leucine-rich repeat protein n=2 Tax=Plasmodium berghei TaxID=5821 RepID=A0A509APF5_PLABA|nr:leucine-rich repeat protein [Plasmodium berghei ANKA]CXI39488.1 leucine-rich repeat protein [Plasmodium berghei]SCM21719.1 leucine-rich repeat protein [Plasmodium berghei]SCN24977.1 leucine-rich repeat protein [Plasmodium berghei]SCO60044.1 leucine-rich repeat protein [Plasmodium berghei]SCO61509.1 leucine-rich repeat protein [Plasmodium berghei]|eukprot:XP_034421377.1 leucine-rich repeat protein [Plasmodium berghei ANKA]